MCTCIFYFSLFLVGLEGGFSVGGGNIVFIAFFLLVSITPFWLVFVVSGWGGGLYATSNDGTDGIILVRGRGWQGWRSGVVDPWSSKCE